MAKKKSLSNSFNKLDLFSSNVTFLVNGNQTLGSTFGALTSIILIVLLSIYGFNKFLVMLNYEDTRFNEFVVKNGLFNHELE